MKFLNKSPNPILLDFLNKLRLDYYTKPQLKGDFSVLDKFPAIGLRKFSKEPFNNGEFSVIESIDYLVRSNSQDVRESGIVLFDSYISLVNSHMQRKEGSISSKIFGPEYDEVVDFSKSSCMKPRSFDLRKSSHDFFYYLTDDNLDRIVNNYLKK